MPLDPSTLPDTTRPSDVTPVTHKQPAIDLDFLRNLPPASVPLTGDDFKRFWESLPAAA